MNVIRIKIFQATENRFTACITLLQEFLVLSGKIFHTPVLEDA
jgi:hypothetical protein